MGDIAKMDTSSSRAEESTAIRGASSLTPLALKSPSVESRSTPQGTFQSIDSPGGSSYRLRPSSTTRPAMRSLSAAYNAADNQFNVSLVFCIVRHSLISNISFFCSECKHSRNFECFAE